MRSITTHKTCRTTHTRTLDDIVGPFNVDVNGWTHVRPVTSGVDVPIHFLRL